jgi:hypothetical protein
MPPGYGSFGSSFAVGSRDKDGLVITSIAQPITAPVISTSVTNLVPVPVVAEVAQEVSRADRREFKMAFRAAITDARQAGTLAVEDARELRRASFSPAFTREAERLAVIQMVVSGENPEMIPRDADGKVNAAGINWEGLAKFLQLMLPILLDFLRKLGL